VLSQKLTVRCDDFRALRRNTLCGFAVVTIAELKLSIRDVAIHQKAESRWAQLPAKPQVKDGALIKDTSTGKIAYTPIMEFTNKAVRDAFSAAVIAAVLEHAPDAFNERSAA
jgi:hypothetical protein